MSLEFPHHFSQQIKQIYEEMDQAYSKAANSYKFYCKGCKDNCCETHFFHHTYIECGYLLEGFSQLPETQQKGILAKAKKVVEDSNTFIEKKLPVRLMCPLNLHGRCLIYEYRPMICRLHGIAHELQIPGQPVQYSPGCDAFIDHCKKIDINDYYPLDRTPHYIRMAQLEQAFKKEFQINQRIKVTISEMLKLFYEP
jgi:Fe-S-cluster containining protein